MESVYDKIQFYKFGRKEKEETIEKIRRSLADEKRVLLALTFGSFTRRSSVRDIDLCVYSIPTLDLSELLSLNADVEHDLALPVDLVELMRLPSSFKLRVLKSGILVKGDEKLLHQLIDETRSELTRTETDEE